jgi:hypothetical protein
LVLLFYEFGLDTQLIDAVQFPSFWRATLYASIRSGSNAMHDVASARVRNVLSLAVRGVGSN